MATGARQRDIMRQFLTESVLVTLVGGSVGVASGLLFGAVLILWDVPLMFSLSAMLLAFACAVGTGLVFGYLPARQAAGAATPLELAQQRGLVAEQRRSLEALRQQVDDACSSLAVLLGQGEPATVSSASLAVLQAPSLAAGLPSDLLLRRPDLARAEAQLRAADADLRAARAALLPRLDLSAGASGTAGSLSRVLADPLYSLVAALAAPIFDGGALAAARERSAARREELLADYRQRIIEAFADVQVALNAGTGVEAQWQAQQEVQAQAERALQLAERRYLAGADDLLNLLDAQRTLYVAEDQSAQLRLARLQSGVALARALGGGWCQADPRESPVSRQAEYDSIISIVHAPRGNDQLVAPGGAIPIPNGSPHP